MSHPLLVAEARAASERARQHLTRYHAQRSYTEIMRELMVTLDQCAVALAQRPSPSLHVFPAWPMHCIPFEEGP